MSLEAVEAARRRFFFIILALAPLALSASAAGGTVELSVYKHRGAAVIDVRDTGPGISAEDRERIFDRFYRGDPARVRGGTGLGLALVRSIVILHGGRIDVESSPGMGSGFRVRLPLASAAER
jgi:signal transduction histidine kinase